MDIKHNQLYCMDTMKFFSDCPSKYINIIYTDTPYNLGSEYRIDSQGHYVFKGKGSDFMGKWEAMDGRWWNEYFKEAYRTIKDGGFFITHNIDRQSDMWTYYARRNGFTPMQKLYWLFISNFPKGVDVTKAIDKILGQDRAMIGIRKGAQKKSVNTYGNWGKLKEDGTQVTEYEATTPTSTLAQKYDGYFYGISALKQIMEEILVFWKPFDTTAPKAIVRYNIMKANNKSKNISFHLPVFNLKTTARKINNEIKWTPQLLIAEDIIPEMLSNPFLSHEKVTKIVEVIQPIKYSAEDLIPYFYIPKASKTERDEGLGDDFEYSSISDGRKKPNMIANNKAPKKNIHPSPKPKKLVSWIIDLFTPPEPILIVDTFMGSGVIPKNRLYWN